MKATDLIPYLRHRNIHQCIEALKNDGYDIAYGEYDCRELRKAVQEHQPSIISVDGELVICAGENDRSLFITKSGYDLEEVNTEGQNSTYYGIIVIGRERKADSEKLIIWTPERDSWPMEWEENKLRAKEILDQLIIGSPYLPNHPVIVTFKIPTETDIKNGIRSMTVGPEISIYDKTDPVTECLHEIGHIFWANRLTNGERDRLADYHKTFIKGSVSPIYTNDYQWKNAEEMFATIYLYYVKGKILSDGYMRLLRELEEPGWAILDSIVERIREQDEIQRNWNQTEAIIDEFLLALDEERLFRVHGRGLIKTVVPVTIPAGEHRFNFAVAHQYLVHDYERHFILVEEGVLAGRTIVLKADCKTIDFEFMRKLRRESDALLKARRKKSDEENGAAKSRPVMTEVRARIDEKTESKLAGQRAAGKKYLKRKKHYNPADGSDVGAKKRKSIKTPEDKIGVVMGEFKRGTLRSGGSGKPVRDRKQAIAIAMSEARRMGKAGIDFILARLDGYRKKINEAREKTDLEPTEGQKIAGNYRKGKIRWHGLTISIENPKGTYRTGTDQDGNEWRQKLYHDYGYINRTVGKDGNHVDVFVNSHPDDSDMVFVINQNDPETGEFDEHKVMIGFADSREAVKGYLKNYAKGWSGFGSVVPMAVNKFKDWLANGDHGFPAE